MEALSWSALEGRTAEVDAAALATEGIDVFCSSSAWVLPAHAELQPGGRPVLVEDAGHFVLMTRRDSDERGRALEPLEAAWLLSCPLLGPEPAHSVALLGEVLRGVGDWSIAIVGGLPLERPLLRELITVLEPRYQLRRGPTTRRHLASLEGGADGFLGRRSREFRKSLRKSVARAEAEGLVWVDAHRGTDADATLLGRILDIERRSWKGQEMSGLSIEPMRGFYRAMLPRLRATRALRLGFVQRDGHDVGYILGACLGDTYRGLQFSFDDRLRPIGLGNLMQWWQIERLAAEGVRVYDLGTDVEYKRRWAETPFDTVTALVFP